MAVKTKRTLAAVAAVVLILALLASALVYRKAQRVYHDILDSISASQAAVTKAVASSGAGQTRYSFHYDWAGREASNPFVCHAFGAIEDHTYTNTLEAFQLNYGLGHRVFEVDFDLTDEYFLVASHHEDFWREITGTPEDVPYSADVFRNAPVYGSYTALDYRQIVDLMAEYPDIYIVTDTKYTDRPTVALQFSQLIRYAQETAPEVLDRIVPQIYHEEMLDWVMELYEFPSVIFTLYLVDWTPQSVYDFCLSRGVGYITVEQSLLTPECVELWFSLGVKIAVHTVNDPDLARQFFDEGVDMIYSASLHPDEFPAE